MTRFRRFLDEAELAEHEAFGRQVSASRIAQIDNAEFKKWSRKHEAEAKSMRYGLSRPATRASPDNREANPFGTRAERLARLRRQRHGN